MIEPELWMGLAILCLSGHAFCLGFFLGTQYVTTVATPEPTEWRPEWVQESLDTYAQSPRRPLSAEEVTAYDWDESE